ncbi:MAG TPA: TetR family transcriptional regulator [Mycobacteriales bacterium]|nr:TetR family transcriptional regulator [Mycobacteriales bacterium]
MASVRDQLLDAAYDAAVSVGWPRVRMADVAAAAGVSRQTLYNEFGSRDGLAAELAMRELARFLDGDEAAMDAEDSPTEAARAATAYVLERASVDPLVRTMLIEHGDDGLLPLLTTRAEPVLFTARGRLVDYFLRRWPHLDAADAALAAEVTTRLAMSYVVLPAEPPAVVADRVAVLVDRILAPALRRS